MSFTSMAQSVELAVSYSNVASSVALSRLPSATGSYSLRGGGGDASESAEAGSGNGAGSIAVARSDMLSIALPVFGLVTGALAVLL